MYSVSTRVFVVVGFVRGGVALRPKFDLFFGTNLKLKTLKGKWAPLGFSRRWGSFGWCRPLAAAVGGGALRPKLDLFFGTNLKLKTLKGKWAPLGFSRRGGGFGWCRPLAAADGGGALRPKLDPSSKRKLKT